MTQFPFVVVVVVVAAVVVVGTVVDSVDFADAVGPADSDPVDAPPLVAAALVAMVALASHLSNPQPFYLTRVQACMLPKPRSS